MGDDTWFDESYNQQLLCEQLNQVRIVGNTNMLDRHGVQFEADRLGLYALVVWMEDGPRGAYAEFLMGNVFADYIADHHDDRYRLTD